MLCTYNDATLIDFYNIKTNPLIRERIKRELERRGRIIVKLATRYVLKPL